MKTKVSVVTFVFSSHKYQDLLNQRVQVKWLTAQDSWKHPRPGDKVLLCKHSKGCVTLRQDDGHDTQPSSRALHGFGGFVGFVIIALQKLPWGQEVALTQKGQRCRKLNTGAGWWG